jgi:hypothetical protein
MPNQDIASAIQQLLRQVTAREIAVCEFADRFPGYVTALEGLSHAQRNQAEMAGTRLRLLAAEGLAGEEVHATASPIIIELQYWLLIVPGFSPGHESAMDQPG